MSEEIKSLVDEFGYTAIQCGNWTSGGKTHPALVARASLLSAVERLERELAEAQGRLNETRDALSCSGKDCSECATCQLAEARATRDAAQARASELLEAKRAAEARLAISEVNKASLTLTVEGLAADLASARETIAAVRGRADHAESEAERLRGQVVALAEAIMDIRAIHGRNKEVDVAEKLARAALSPEPAPASAGTARPRIVCLCGSTRFANEFMAAQFQETIAGRIVLTVGCFPRKPDGSWDRMQVSDEQKAALDRLHFRKIELADEVFVVNVGGYVGPSTANKIAHARKLDKPIRWLESPTISPDPGAAGAKERP